MVDELVGIKEIGFSDYVVLEKFLHNAGRSLSSFRYFDTRPISVIENHYVTAVLVSNSAAIGYGHLDKDKDNDVVWLGIAISEMAIGKGFGKLMMSFLVTKADEMNFPCISLTVDKNNTKAIRLYEYFGFLYVRDINEQVQLMERNLNLQG
jgi:ribosomal protein S18 acetylase RimI-like enzyme